MDSLVKNVLADRYASESVKAIWSEAGKIRIERQLWVAVLKAQKKLGISIPQDAIRAYESQIENINLESIRKRELVTKHDVKARIDEFCELAGYQEIHKGMTSRDLTENVEQLQIYRSLSVILNKAVNAAQALANQAENCRNLAMPARTHNVPAQPTSLGRRFAMFGEEFLTSITSIDSFYKNFSVRGLKGAVGTQTDQLTLFDGDSQKAEALDQELRGFLGIPHTLQATGQVYPRSLDFELVSRLYQLSAAPTNFARTIRLMAGHETASEGFAKGQTGSSAMPHKMNSRSCERIQGFRTLLSGYVTMASNLAGDQWHEGDVSCSVVRRVLLPDAFFAIDGLLNTWLTVLNQLTVYPAMIQQELEQFTPFLLSTTVLMEAVKKGVGRETAHHIIKKHAIEEINTRRSEGILSNQLAERLASDPDLRLNSDELESIFNNIQNHLGNSQTQIDAFLHDMQNWVKKYPDSQNIETVSIL